MGRQKHKGCGNPPVVNDYWRASWSNSKDRRHISLLVNSQQQHTSSAMYYNLYPNEYYVIHNGNSYSKHVYMDGERIATLVGSNNNLLDGYCGSNVDVAGVQFIQGNPDAYYASKCADKEDDLMNSLENDFGKTYYPSYLQNTVIYNGAQVTDLPYYYHHDHLGSTCLVTDSLGNVDQRIEYMPDGNIFFQTVNGSYSTPFRFNGQEFDDDTELYYYGARYYDRKLGIWTSTDPMELDYPGISSYAYCAGNPVNAIDPNGNVVIPIHGTWAKEDTWKNLDGIINATNNLFGDKTLGNKFKWSGDNSSKQRTIAAKELISKIREELNGLDSSEPITLVGHSHGGNVGIEAINMMMGMEEFKDRKINLLTINTPVRDDYQLSKIAQERVNHVNVYDPQDPVQVRGGKTTIFGINMEIGTAGRVFKNAYNIRVDNPQGVLIYKRTSCAYQIPGTTYYNPIEIEGIRDYHEIHNSHNRVQDWIKYTKK
ncbi:MAG: RHS repeat-associated core domain-containing protein [Prevotella sp.]|nr:RHS repeat-associated core domain-containing protein [Prevotella sp.]